MTLFDANISQSSQNTHLSSDGERPALGVQSFYGDLYESWFLHDLPKFLLKGEKMENVSKNDYKDWHLFN